MFRLSANNFLILQDHLIQTAITAEKTFGFHANSRLDSHDWITEMKPNNETCWWIDHAGSTHVNTKPTDLSKVLAMGLLYTDSQSGVITHLRNQPAKLSLISRSLLDVLHAQFPGTRWWIKDPTPSTASSTEASHQTAS